MGTCAGVSTRASQPPAPLGEHTAPRGAPRAPCSLLGSGSEHPAAPRGSAPLGDGVLTGVPRPGLGVSPAAVGLRGAEAGVALGAVPDKGGEEDDGEELEEEAQPGQTEPQRGSSTLSHTGGGQQTPNRAGGSLQTPPVGPPAPARTPEGSRQTRARRGARGCCWQRKRGKEKGGGPLPGGVPSLPGQLEGEGFVCFALLRSAFRWLLPPGRVCCAPGAQTPKRKRKRKKGAEGARLAFGKRLRWLPALPGWDFGDPEPGWGPRMGNDSGLGLWSWWDRWALLLGHCEHRHSPFVVPRLREAAAGPKPQPGAFRGGFRVCFGSHAHSTEPTAARRGACRADPVDFSFLCAFPSPSGS